MFLWLFADSYLGYGFPILLEESLGSTLAMGLVLSFSSLVGITMDFLVPRVFGDRSWRRILFLGLVIAIFFPVFAYLGVVTGSIIMFLAASAVWGIHYEFIMFGSQDYVSNEEKSINHERDWTLFNINWQVAILIAPIVAGVLIVQGIVQFTGVAAFFYIAALISFLLLMSYRRQPHSKQINTEIPEYDLAKFRVYLRKLFFPFLASLTLITVNTVYWDLAGLFGLQLSNAHNFPDWGIFTSYSTGMLVGTLLKLKFSFKDKKLAISKLIMLTGLLLIPVMFIQNPWLICLTLFLSSIVSAFSYPLLSTIYSHEAEDAKEDEMYVLSVERMTGSLAYIVMPTVLGALAGPFGFASTFSLAGILIVLSSIILYMKALRSKRKETA